MSIAAVGMPGPWNGTQWETTAAHWLRQPRLLRALCGRGAAPPRLFLPGPESSVDLQEDLARLAFSDDAVVHEALNHAPSPDHLSKCLHPYLSDSRLALAQILREANDYSCHVFGQHWPLLRTQLVSAIKPALTPSRRSVRPTPSAFVVAARTIDFRNARVVVFPLPERVAAFEPPERFQRWQQPLADLLGARRAVILLLLYESFTTDEVAAMMRLERPATAYHMRVLQRAGLIEHAPDERRLWRRTEVGTRLVALSVGEWSILHRGRQPA